MPYDGTAPSGKRTDLLLLIADAVERAPPSRYDQRHFKKGVGDCGTVHCALGWGIAFYGEQLGLKFSEQHDFTDTTLIDPIEGEPWTTRHGYTANRLWGGLASHLGITPSEAKQLFGGVEDAVMFYGELTPAIVAKKIQEFALAPVELGERS